MGKLNTKTLVTVIVVRALYKGVCMYKKNRLHFHFTNQNPSRYFRKSFLFCGDCVCNFFRLEKPRGCGTTLVFESHTQTRGGNLILCSQVVFLGAGTRSPTPINIKISRTSFLNFLIIVVPSCLGGGFVKGSNAELKADPASS